jgi:glycosyltransferase involved in cell wall biosynthesis
MNVNSKIKVKIAIIHPTFFKTGGSEATAAYIADALQNDYEVSLITIFKTKVDQINKDYGTRLSKGIKIITPHRLYIPVLVRNVDAIRGALFARFCRRFINSFNLLIYGYNVMDLRGKGIQFIADLCFDDKLRRKTNPAPTGVKAFFYRGSILRKIYLRIISFLSGERKDGFKKNITIANSKWSAEILKKEFDIESEVIYPPVTIEFPEIPWEKRKEDFVYVGRLIPKKGIETIIEILDKVREMGYDLKLHIIGPLDDTRYVRKLKKIAREKGGWIKLEGAKYKKDKVEFLAHYKYGISGRINEPFGISVAEMVKAGCIVWVPDSGGQIEIVSNENLTFKNIEDAVLKIEKVLKDSKLQEELRNHLKKQSLKFSAEIFKREVRKLIEKYFENKS